LVSVYYSSQRNKIEDSFALLRIVQNIAIAVTCGVAPILNMLHVKLLIPLCCLAFTSICVIILDCFAPINEIR